MKNILVVDSHFIKNKYVNKFNFINIFPRINTLPNFKNSYQNLLNRGYNLKYFVDQCLPIIAKEISKSVQIEDEKSLDLIRPVLVTLASLYIDRAIRLEHILKSLKKTHLYVLKVPFFNDFDRLDEIRSLSNMSWHFNQSILQKLATYLEIEELKVLKFQEFPEYPPGVKVENFLQHPISASLSNYKIKLRNKFLLKMSYYLKKIPSIQSTISCLGLSGDDYFLSINGFYGPFGLLTEQKKIDWVKVKRNKKLRKKIKDCLNNKLEDLLLDLIEKETGSNTRINKIFSENFLDFFFTYFPVNFLEGAKQNLLSGERVRKMKSEPILLGGDMITDEGYFLSSITKNKNGIVIGSQHGGYYGYIEGMTNVTEFEYNLYDKMLTWGWNKFETRLSKTTAVVLPSPRLSEFSRFYKKRQILNSDNKILLMTNLIHRFPHISTCGQARIDFLDEIIINLENLIKVLVKNEFKLYHKPYNSNYLNLLRSSGLDLNKIKNKNYHLIQPNLKGLIPEMINSFDIILWDQIGTGTLECFVGEIPTMIYWKRIYSKENKFSKALIKELEVNGVIHSTIKTLIKELTIFMQNPKNWMNNKYRKKSIENFCNNFAKNDINWKIIWKKKLKNL